MKRIIFGITLCLFASMVHATGSRNLMLMMNWSDETLNDGQLFGALSQVTISALEQQAGPIIITSQTWRSIMGRGTNLRYPDYQLSREVFYQSNATFRYNDWIIKKLSDYLYVFVPKSYLAASRAKKDSYNQDLNTAATLTQDDRDLGLKISKFPDISQNDLFNVNYHKAYMDLATYQSLTRKNTHATIKQLMSTGNQEVAELYFFSQHVLYMLGKLLITRADVLSKIDPRQNLAQFKEDTEKNEALLLHEWLVYLDGHGSPSDTGQIKPIIVNRSGYYPGPSDIGITAGLEHNSFQQILKFLNGSVVTGAMLYASCFAGGQHLAKLYEKEWDAFLRNPQKQIKKDSYNYLILTTNIWYTATESAVLDYIQFPAFFSLLYNFIHQPQKPIQKNYVKGKIKQPVKKGSTFEVTAQLASIVSKVSMFNLSKRFQVPGVRFPYTEWFVAIDDPTLPILFEKSNNRVVQSKKKLVQQQKTSALQDIIRKKYAGQQQLAQQLAELSEQRRKELEAIRIKEEKAKGEKLYSGIMKLQQKTKENVTQGQVPMQPSQPKVPQQFQPSQQVPVTPSFKPTPQVNVLSNALMNLQNALRQLESNLQYMPQQMPHQQPFFGKSLPAGSNPQYGQQRYQAQKPEYEEEPEEDEYSDEEYEDENFSGQEDEYNYDSEDEDDGNGYYQYQ